MGNLNQTDLERSQIERALARIEDALRRCRTEDVRYGMGIAATLDFLELRSDEKWPFKQFRDALEGFDARDQLKAEARWQVLNASLNGIKRGCSAAEFGLKGKDDAREHPPAGLTLRASCQFHNLAVC